MQLEVSELLPQGSLACGSHSFTATLLIDPLMSVLRFVGFFFDIPCLDFCLIWCICFVIGVSYDLLFGKTPFWVYFSPSSLGRFREQFSGANFGFVDSWSVSVDR